MVSSIVIFINKLFLLIVLFLSSLIQIFHQDIATQYSFGRENKSTQIVVLCYHHVGLPFYCAYSISGKRLIAQLDALANEGFTFVTLKQVEDFYYKQRPLPQKSAVVTFDDANYSVFANAYPLLKAKNIPFAVFAYPNIIDFGHRRHSMSWEDLRTLNKNGVTIGSHSYYHPFLTLPLKRDKINTPEQYSQWLDLQALGSKQRLEEQLGVSVNYFAVPFGAFDEYSQKKIINAGYKLIFNVKEMNNDQDSNPYNLNRTIVLASHSVDNLINFSKVRPLSFTLTEPRDLERTNATEVTANFKIRNINHYDLNSFRLSVSRSNLDEPLEYNSIKSCFEKKLSLAKEGFYLITVTAQDLAGAQHKGTVFVLKNKTTPAFYPVATQK